jgi:hypothetical protein
MTDLKNFFTRWSRRKRGAATLRDLTPGESRKRSRLPLPVGERVGVRGAVPIARPEPLTPPLSQWEREPTASADTSSSNAQTAAGFVFDPAKLPPIESITAESDIRAFLAPGVPAELSRAALRRAWAADPKIRDFVGLAENSWDFNATGTIPGFGPLEMTEELRSQIARLLDREAATGAGDMPTPLSAQAQGGPATIEESAISTAADAKLSGSSAVPAAESVKPEVSLTSPAAGNDQGNGPLKCEAERHTSPASSTKKLHGGALPQG